MTTQITQRNNVFLNRDDTFFGVCEAIGRDFGFNPNWLRLALAVPMAIYPLVSLGIYIVLGIAVLASRLIAPEARAAKSVQAITPPSALTRQDNAEPPFELPLAA